MLTLLRTNSHYLKYWMSTWVSDLADWIRRITVMFVIMNLASHSKTDIPISLFFDVAPAFFFGPIMSVFVDRFNRKKMLTGAYLLMAVFTAFFFFAVHDGSIALIMAGTFFSSVASTVVRSASSAFTVQFVPQEDMKTAVSLRQFIGAAMAMAGAPIATFLFTKEGVDTTLSAYVVCLLLAAVIVFTINGQWNTEKSKGITLGQYVRDLASGFTVSFKNRNLRPLLIGTCFVGLSAGLLNALEIFLITEFLHLPQTMYAELMTIEGVAMVVFTLVIAQLKVSAQKLGFIGLLTLGVSFAVMVSYRSFGVLILGYILMSFANIAYNIAVATTVRTKIEFSHVGRADTIATSLTLGFMTVASLIATVLHQYLTMQEIMFVAAFLALIGTPFFIQRKKQKQTENGSVAA